MMRWLPRSLFSRMVLVLLGGLVVAQVAGLAVYWRDRDEFVQRAMGMRSVQRIADITRLLEPMTPAERSRIVGVIASPALRIALDLPALPAAADPDAGTARQSAAFSAALARQLPGVPLVVQLAQAPTVRGPRPGYGMGGGAMGPGMMGGAGPGFGPPGPYFVAQVRLTDGTLVTFDARQSPDAANWPYRLLLSLGILLAAVIVLTLLAARWVTRPLKTLAHAAEALGEDIERPPLDESGPLEVSRAARAFNQMQQRLAKYIGDRTRIFAAMSHDLKTPITRLRLRAELLDDPALREKFEKDLLDMEAMVQATLDFMRGLERQEPVQPLDIVALLHALEDEAGELHGKVHVDGAAQPYPGRMQALKRCLGNLVHNALQYGGAAHVAVTDADDELVVRIRDAGPGMPESELERVFDPFYRLEGSRSRSTGGTGLGLTIARSIARAHGGEVTLRNVPAGGLEATVRLPRARSRDSASGASGARPARAATAA